MRRRWPWVAAAVAVGIGLASQRSRSLPYAGKPCTAQGCRPSFLIIGIGKCGTSSLYYYLAAHPSVIQARRKQIQFFDHAYDASRISSRYLSQFPSSLMMERSRARRARATRNIRKCRGAWQGT